MGRPLHASHQASSGCVTCSISVGRKDTRMHMTCCLCAPDPTTEDSQLQARAQKALPARPTQPLPKARVLLLVGTAKQLLSLAQGALLSSLAALCQGSEGLRAWTSPTCQAAGHSLSRPNGYLGLSRALCPSQYFPSPLWGRERGAHFSS